MKLSDIMTQNVVTVGMDATVEAIRDIFAEHSFHHLVVTKQGRVVGLISDRDLLNHVSPFIGKRLMERTQDLNTLQKKAHQVMDRQPVVAHVDTAVDDAVMKLLKENVTCLPVVDDMERLRGIVTWRDLLKRCRFCEAAEPTDRAA